MEEIKLLELSNKEVISKISKDIKSRVLDGELQPLDVAMALKGMEDLTKSIRGDSLVQDAIIEEVEKYGKVANYKGAKITVKEVGTKYHFNECNDPVWDFLKQQMDEISQKMKDREAFLKSIKGHETIVNEETGEVYTIKMPGKESKTGYMVTL